MQYRKFGRTDLTVSRIGFGAWAIGGNAKVGNIAIGWGPADPAASKKALQAARTAGINFFDTADFYGLGFSESLIGDVLGKDREALIATKVGQRAENETIVADYSKDYIIRACEASLKRLQRETIDYYQLHNARLSHLQDGACIDAMETLQQQGKIRYWGLSLNTFHPEPEARFLLAAGQGDGFQLVFNIINQRAAILIRDAAAAGYGLIARMPLQFGLLTGKFKENATFATDDHRRGRLTPEILKQALGILQTEVWPQAEQEGLTPTDLALQFAADHPGISTVIPGLRTSEQVALNTVDAPLLSDSLRDRLTEMGSGAWLPVLEAFEQAG